MKRISLFLCLCAVCVLLLPLAAQQGPEYMITASELEQLESISVNLQISTQNLLLQASDLTTRLKAQEQQAKTLAASLQQAENTASSLRSQLQTERKTLKALRQSYNAYEIEVAQHRATQQAIIDKQKDTLHRRMIAIIILSSVIIMAVIATAVKWFIKGKLRFLHPP